MPSTLHPTATALAVFSLATGALAAPAALSLNLAALHRLGQVSERYQAYNVEIVEVTGGRFWAPYGGAANEVYRQRPPLDLRQARLVQLARHLGPSLMRVSGTWANTTYVPAPGEWVNGVPDGFGQVLQPEQWQAVLDFSRAVDAPVVTSFAVGAGTRDAAGHWTPVQAQRLLDLTRRLGGQLYAAEFFNEPNVPMATPGLPKGYSADDYARDFQRFRAWARQAAPEMQLLGPGSLSEGALLAPLMAAATQSGVLPSAELMARTPNSVDVVSYHTYGSVSQRCAYMKIGTADKTQALQPEWLDRTLLDQRHYAALRDRFEPGKPLWNTETAQAACGGSPWAASFLDSFRYLNQLGALAQQGVQVVMHNTLAASDYALIDEAQLQPRPNYWAAVLWKQTMGRTVLAPPPTPTPAVRWYAHCTPQGQGGVGLLVLNTGTDTQTLHLGALGHVALMQAAALDSDDVRVNGQQPSLDAQGHLQGLESREQHEAIELPARSVAFIRVPGADHPACR